jgi:type I restriction modification DNA specificity domain protein
MKKYKLGELIEVTRGTSLSGNYYATSGDYIRLTCGNFDYRNNCFKENSSKDNIYYIGEFKSDFLLNEGDIITPLTEQAIGLLGSTAWIPESGKYIQSQDIGKIICKEKLLDKKFAYYLLSSKEVKKQLSAGAQQTKIRHTSPSKIKDCIVWIPSLYEQKNIGEILFNIDRKIALNKAINHNLVAMAKQLYDYWFVQFDFPNQDSKPYKSNGGKMVWNEKLKREIPEGWEVKELGKIEPNIVTGKTPSTINEKNFGGNIPFITIDDIRGNTYIFKTQRTLSNKGAESQKNKYLKDNSLCVSCIGTIGVMGFNSILSQTNQQINSIIFSKEENREYIYFSLKLYFEHTSAKTGNIFANMNKEEFSSILIVVPTLKLISRYHNIVGTFFKEIRDITEQIYILTKQRDELLPLLMNGQARVE